MTDSFGELLRRFRVGASLTQEALAHRCQISPATVAAIEQGRRKAPRLTTVRLIAEALELSAAERATLAEAAQRAGAGEPGRATSGGAGASGAGASGAGASGAGASGDGAAGVGAAGDGAAGVGAAGDGAAGPAVGVGRLDGQPGVGPAVRAAGPAAPALAPARQVIGLPTAWTSFVGRGAEQAAVLAALAESRVVSLVGPGGVGKTRLAIRVAELAAASFSAGAVYVDLVPVREGFVSQAVAALLGLTEGPGRSLDAALHEHLARGRWLLALDNCEHLLAVVAAFVEKLLADCANLTVLVTSRERLAIPGERLIAVPPLPLARAGQAGAAPSEAEVLFVDRALASDPASSVSPAAVRDVCARLDGMPLAIEIAAARSASLGMDGLLAGLDDHLRLLAGSRRAHTRHRSLRAVIDWSHDLLDADERVMFRRLGAFVGAFDLDAAVAVSARSRGVAADLLGRLTDKSLLSHRSTAAGSRWQMLETIRAYAIDKLAASEDAAAVRRAHLGWAAEIAVGLERQAANGQPWRSAFDAVADDLRAAAGRGAEPGTQDTGHRLARTLGHLAYARRFMVEAREHYLAAAARAGDQARAAADVRSAADVAMAEGHGDVAFALLIEAAGLARAAGDDSALASALAWAAVIADRFAAQFAREVPHSRLRALLDEAVSRCPSDDAATAAQVAAAAAWIAEPEKTVPDPGLAEAALAAARGTGDPVLISGALDAVVGVLDAGGRLRQAHRVNSERARLLGQLPRHEPRAGIEIIDTIHMVTEIAVTAGDLPGALASARLAAADDIARGQPHMTASKPVLPLVLQGRFDEAVAPASLMWESWQQAGRPPARWMGPALYGMVLAHGLRGDDDGRRDWLARVAELVGAGGLVAGANLAAVAAFTSARIAVHDGRADAAAEAIADLAVRAGPWYCEPHWYSLRPYAWAVAAEVAVLAGEPDAAARLAAAAPAGAENYWAAACLARATGRLHGDRDALERSVTAWEHIGARFERACTLLLIPARAAEGGAELRALGCAPPARW